MTWKRFLIAIVSVVIVSASIKLVQACYFGDDPYDLYPSFFKNDIGANPAYRPFYYTSYLTFYDEPDYGDVPGVKLSDANIPEWNNYSDHYATEKDIERFVYQFSKQQVASVYDNIAKGTTLDTSTELRNNSFAKWLINTKNKAAAHYLLFAKECEAYSGELREKYDTAGGEWAHAIHDSAAMQELVAKGLEKSENAKSDFLQWRYAYQTLRMAFYSGNYKQTLRLYDELCEGKEGSGVMPARCLSLKAGALFRTRKKAEAAYEYSRVFDQSDEAKKKALISFNWAIYSDYDDVLKLCRNNHEKAVIYIMDALYEKIGEDMEGLGLMETAYKLDPKVKGLNEVMVREINKAEASFFQHDLNRIERNADSAEWEKAKSDYLPYFAKLISFSDKVAADGKTGHSAFWHLAGAYICFIEGDYKGCHQMITKADNERMTPGELDQRRIINVLYNIRKDGSITTATEAKILPTLQYIKENESSNLFRDVITRILADAYRAQGDTVHALFCMGLNGGDNGLLESMSYDKIHEAEVFVNRLGNSPFDAWLIDHNTYQSWTLYEFEGTKYIREHRFDKAVEVLNKSSWSPADNILPEFLISHIKDNQVLDADDKKHTYNKLEFATIMLGLQKKIEKNPKDARTAYQYANGLYSMTYYGKAYQAYSDDRSPEDERAYNDVDPKLPVWEQDYYSASTAMKYYLLAYNDYTDPEMKARCLFMASKCWQKSGGRGDEYYDNSLASPYFEQIKGKYSKTRFYKTALNTCSYFRDYVKQK